MKVLVPAPSQTGALGGLMEHIGGWFTVIVTLPVPVFEQPFASVTFVIMYVVVTAGVTLRVCVPVPSPGCTNPSDHVTVIGAVPVRDIEISSV